MLRRLATSERLTTIILLLGIVLLGIKITQYYLPKPPSPAIAFTCAVAAHSQAGELCVKGASGASVSIAVHYCDGTQVNSPQLRDQEDGEYRWIWRVATSCRGPGSAWAKAIAVWPGNKQAEAIATFDVA
jgi:hypothetical protein